MPEGRKFFRMSKLDDMKALRGSQLQRLAADAPKPRPAKKIIDGLKEAIASVEENPKLVKVVQSRTQGSRPLDAGSRPALRASSGARPIKDGAVIPAPVSDENAVERVPDRLGQGIAGSTPPSARPEAEPKKIGRPKIVGEPWIEAGMSRRSWYRERRAKASKGKKDE